MSLPQTILEEARRLAIRDGAANLSLSRAAAAAGVTKGGLLHHFRNKAALLEAMLSANIAAIEEAYQNRHEAMATPTSRDRLEAYALSMVDLADRDPNPWLSSAALMAISSGATMTFRRWRRTILASDDRSEAESDIDLCQGVLEGIALSGQLDGAFQDRASLSKLIVILTALPPARSSRGCPDVPTL